MNDIDRTIYDLIVNWPDSTPITAGTVADKLGIPRSRKQIERPLGRLWRLGKLVRKENNSRNFVYSIRLWLDRAELNGQIITED